MAASIVSALPNWAAAGTGAGAGFFMVKWFFEWVGGRVDKREAHAEKAQQRVDGGMDTLIKHLQDQIEKQAKQIGGLLERVDMVERELSECRTKHNEAQAEVMKLRAIVQGFGDAKQQAAAIIAAERVMDRQVAEIVEKSKEK